MRELVPQLCYLDNLRVEETKHYSSSTTGEDWVILQNTIKESSRATVVGGLCFKCGRGSFHAPLVVRGLIFVSAGTAEITCPGSRMSSASPLFSPSFVCPPHSADSRPPTGSRTRSAIWPGPSPPIGPRPGSAGLRLKETSVVTHG